MCNFKVTLQKENQNIIKSGSVFFELVERYTIIFWLIILMR